MYHKGPHNVLINGVKLVQFTKTEKKRFQVTVTAHLTWTNNDRPHTALMTSKNNHLLWKFCFIDILYALSLAFPLLPTESLASLLLHLKLCSNGNYDLPTPSAENDR